MKSSLKGVAPEWYTIEDEAGTDDPPQFYLKPLDGFGATEISMISIAARDGEISLSEGARIGSELLRRAFQLGVKGWRNIEDGDCPGEPLGFSTAAMRRMKAGWIMEVGARVLEISNLSPAEVKNSDSPSSSPAN